jgi:hypothetical protein
MKRVNSGGRQKTGKKQQINRGKGGRQILTNGPIFYMTTHAEFGPIGL